MGILVSTVNYPIRKANKHISLLSTLLNRAQDRLLLLPANTAVSANASAAHKHIGQAISRTDRNLQAPIPRSQSACNHNNVVFSLKSEVNKTEKCTL
jgi:hypothetical protein